jgi:hypothetical protein
MNYFLKSLYSKAKPQKFKQTETIEKRWKNRVRPTSAGRLIPSSKKNFDEIS